MIKLIKNNRKILTIMPLTMLVTLFAGASSASLFSIGNNNCSNNLGCNLPTTNASAVLNNIQNGYSDLFGNGLLHSSLKERFSSSNGRSTRPILGNPINCGALFDRDGNSNYYSTEINGIWYFVYNFTESNSMIEMQDTDNLNVHTGIDISLSTELDLNRSVDQNLETLSSSWNEEGFVQGTPIITRNNATNFIIPSFFCDSRIPDSVVETLAMDNFKYCSDSNQSTDLGNVYKGAINIGTNGRNFNYNNGSSNFDFYNSIMVEFSDVDNQRIQNIFRNENSGYCIPDNYKNINNVTLEQYCDTGVKTVRNSNFGGRDLLLQHNPNIDQSLIDDIPSTFCTGTLDVKLKAGEERKVMVRTIDEVDDLFYGYVTFQCNRNSNGNLELITLNNESNNCNPEIPNFFSSQAGIPSCSEELCMYTGGLSCTDSTVMWGDNNQCWGELTYSYSQVPTSGNARTIFSESDANGSASFHCIEGQWRLSGMNGATTCQ